MRAYGAALALSALGIAVVLYLAASAAVLLKEGSAPIAQPAVILDRVLHDREVQGTLWSLGAVAAIGLIYVIVSLRSGDSPLPASGYGSHGTGRWASIDEIRRAFADSGPGAVLGRLAGKSKPRVVIFPWATRRANRFVLIIGPPGSGKTTRVTLPNLLHAAACDRERSIIATDPKGELYRATANLMEQSGFRVLVLNLADLNRSLRFNPMDYVENAEDAQRLAATIVTNTEGPHSGGEPFWKHAEEALIACLIWYCKTALPRGQQHLGSVMHLAAAFAADPDLMADAFGEFPPESSVRRLYGPVAGLKDKTRDGVFVGVTASRLKLWASDRVIDLTSSSDFRFDDLASQPTVLYLILPDHDTTYRVLSSLFFDQAFQRLITIADAAGGRLDHEVRILLEELANVGRIPDLEKRLATVRSRGLICEMVIQTLGQLKALYGDAWSTIVGCSDTLMVLGANDQETADYVSRRLGVTTIKTASSSHTQAERGGSDGLSYQYTSRPLMFPDEVQGQTPQGLQPDELIVIQRGMPPARVQKYPVDEFPLSEAMVPTEPSAYPVPKKGRAELPDIRSLRRLQTDSPTWLNRARKEGA